MLTINIYFDNGNSYLSEFCRKNQKFQTTKILDFHMNAKNFGNLNFGDLSFEYFLQSVEIPPKKWQNASSVFRHKLLNYFQNLELLGKHQTLTRMSLITPRSPCRLNAVCYPCRLIRYLQDLKQKAIGLGMGKQLGLY